jgi:endonuclease/exonuclease/phosphatase family metal-dependent hydrolase
MNLCLSGLAGCDQYPAVLDEAAARIREVRPDAVTVNEACSHDVALIARRTGYHLSFSRVIYAGRPLRCVRPGGRGLFGDAVLTRAAIEAIAGRPFKALEGIERRQWLCVRGSGGVEVCTAHLNTELPTEIAGNDGQCAELAALLGRRAAGRNLIFGGDVNRRGSCAPHGLWTRGDSSAAKDPGLQQVYGTSEFSSPEVKVLPATRTDHDYLLVRAHLATGS